MLIYQSHFKTKDKQTEHTKMAIFESCHKKVTTHLQERTRLSLHAKVIMNYLFVHCQLYQREVSDLIIYYNPDSAFLDNSTIFVF